jgi:hypothetical protein
MNNALNFKKSKKRLNLLENNCLLKEVNPSSNIGVIFLSIFLFNNFSFKITNSFFIKCLKIDLTTFNFCLFFKSNLAFILFCFLGTSLTNLGFKFFFPFFVFIVFFGNSFLKICFF